MNDDAPRFTPRQKRIIKAAQQGIAPSLIATRFGTTSNAICKELSRIRAKGGEVDDFRRGAGKRAPSASLRIQRSKLGILRREAKRRGISTRELAERIIAHAVKRGLVADILDGGET